ncbi:MAG: CoA-transferase subunit beta [bacterium]
MSTNEILATLTAREIADNTTAFVGIGISQLAVELAKLMGKRVSIIYEGGSVDPVLLPSKMPYSTNDLSVGYKATMYPTCVETFLYMQRGLVDVALMGAAQIDRYGNINTTYINRPGSAIYLPGSGGGCDLASLAKETYIITALEKRKFVEKVDYITSPGHVKNRAVSGLLGNGPSKVITDKAIFYFNSKGEMELGAIMEGFTVDDVLQQMGFKPAIREKIFKINPPTDKELYLLRSLDPSRVFL